MSYKYILFLYLLHWRCCLYVLLLYTLFMSAVRCIGNVACRSYKYILFFISATLAMLPVGRKISTLFHVRCIDNLVCRLYKYLLFMHVRCKGSVILSVGHINIFSFHVRCIGNITSMSYKYVLFFMSAA